MENDNFAGIIVIILIVLLILLALVVVAAKQHCDQFVRSDAAPVRGGAKRRERGSGILRAHADPLPHGIGKALYDYARGLGPEHVVGTHPLENSTYEPLPAARDYEPARETYGGEAAASYTARGGRGRKWDEYETWEDMRKNNAALAAYFKDRTKAITNPNLDWTAVLAEMNPKLHENREYIGVASLEPDGKTLRLVASEASPITTKDMQHSDTAFAGVPSDLVMKYASKPGLILFHTHPADIRGSPLPSSHDLSTAIYLGATSRFAACAVISRYGVLMHGIGWDAYKAINSASDWKLAVLNLSHDVVAAHESVRSWSMHTIAEYLAFYPRHRLFMYVFPSPEMVGDTQHYTWMWDLESPIDYEIISEHGADIARHRARAPTRGKDSKKASKLSAKNAIDISSIGFD